MYHRFTDSVVDGIAVDYIGRWLYYTETELDIIKKVSLDGGNPIEVVNLAHAGSEVEPRDIVLDLDAK